VAGGRRQEFRSRPGRRHTEFGESIFDSSRLSDIGRLRPFPPELLTPPHATPVAQERAPPGCEHAGAPAWRARPVARLYRAKVETTVAPGDP
jgi:hypothetical protein